jgi:hypothetical protein
MSIKPGVVERAYQMARSGQYVHVVEIEGRLNRENYFDVSAQLSGLTLRRELRRICHEARRTPAKV